jgi:(2R)-3-sulfolactate dehydrogenase (NADP+)
VKLALDVCETLACDALVASNTSQANARAVARALVAAEADGQRGHGLSRIPSYAAQAKSGKVNGHATPTVTQAANAALRIDAGYGFSYPAINLAIEGLEPLAKKCGIGIAAIHRSHHFGQAGAHAERLADCGLVALVFGNSPKAMAFYGGKKSMMGTNPIAFAAPVHGGAPLVIDLALSQAARGKVIAAQKAGESIPGHWALDANGNPTTDPASALQGTMVPIGGAKGASLALMVEVLSAALTGSFFGFEASSLFEAEGEAPNLGQTIIAIDPGISSAGAFGERMAVIAAAMDAEEGVRLPGSSRLANRRRARAEGLFLPENLYAEILEAS